MSKVFFFFISILILFSCHSKKTDTGPTVLGQDYYPLDSGRYWIYTVHKQVYNTTNIDTTYQIMELIYDTIHYGNNVIYQLYRYYRPNVTYAWPSQPDSVWTINCTSYELDITENEIEYVRLAFPLSNSEVWNGNARNALSAQQYSISNLGLPYVDTVSTSMINTYSQACNVQEAQSFNLVGKDYRNRIYAKGIGLVYKKYETVSYDTNSGNIGLYIITFGTIIEQQLLGYGKP